MATRLFTLDARTFQPWPDRQTSPPAPRIVSCCRRGASSSGGQVGEAGAAEHDSLIAGQFHEVDRVADRPGRCVLPETQTVGPGVSPRHDQKSNYF